MRFPCRQARRIQEMFAKVQAENEAMKQCGSGKNAMLGVRSGGGGEHVMSPTGQMVRCRE